MIKKRKAEIEFLKEKAMTVKEQEKQEETRDMFAGMAMYSVMKMLMSLDGKTLKKEYSGFNAAEIVAIESYNYADAMIEERNKRLKKRADDNHICNKDETKKETETQGE